MKAKFLLAAVIFANTLPFSSAFATESALGSCIVGSMTSKERKVVAQWLFFAMAAHPEIKEYSKISEAAKRKTDESMANLFTKLLTEDCLTQAKAAHKREGQAAIVGAFDRIGVVAMEELMMNKDVSNSIGAYAEYLDTEKLNKISSEK